MASIGVEGEFMEPLMREPSMAYAQSMLFAKLQERFTVRVLIRVLTVSDSMGAYGLGQ